MRSFSIFLYSLIILVSCRKEIHRFPASDFEINQAVIQETFDIPKLSLSSDESEDWDQVAKNMQKRLSSIENVTGDKNLKVIAVQEQMPNNIGARLAPEISEDGQFIIKIYYSAKEDHASKRLVTKMTEKLTDTKVLQTYYDLFEWSYNIKEGHAESIESFHRLKMETLNTIDLDGTAENAAVLENLNDRTADLENLTKDLSKQRKIEEKARKDLLASLDRAGESEQLKSLVAANKREEVADLLNKYLPREQMSPFENKFWDQILETMRNPLPLKNRVLVFRGIDEDMIYSALGENGKELAKEEALAKSKAFMMSSLLTKNQGTWNRRLRSLQTVNEKFLGSNNVTNSTEWTKNFRVSTFFKQHSRNPQGSPFLSFTPKVTVSSWFGKKRSAAYLIDPRALLANTATSYSGEFEFLTSIVTFPDELVDIYDEALHGSMSDKERQARFLEKTKLKLIEEYGQVEGEISFNEIHKIFKHFNDFNDVAQLEKNAKKEGFITKMMNFFKKKPALEIIETVDPVSKSCNYVLKSIWNL